MELDFHFKDVIAHRQQLAKLELEQNTQAGKSYTGTVTFTAANGGKITAQFSSGS